VSDHLDLPWRPNPIISPGFFAGVDPDTLPVEILRPAVPLLLHGPAAECEIWAMPDSGSTLSTFPAGLLEPLGIPKAECFETITNVGTFDKERHRAWHYGPGIEATVAGRWRIRLAATFTDHPDCPALVGTDDFFAAFRVSFDRAAKLTRLEPYEPNLLAAVVAGEGVAS
jgi:hypothetical protein